MYTVILWVQCTRTRVRCKPFLYGTTLVTSTRLKPKLYRDKRTRTDVERKQNPIDKVHQEIYSFFAFCGILLMHFYTLGNLYSTGNLPFHFEKKDNTPTNIRK